MAKTRELVKVEIKNNTVTIKGLPILPKDTEDYIRVGTFFTQVKPTDLKIKKGDKIRIANQLRVWKLDAVKINKFGKAVAFFNKYNDNGERIDTFYLIDGEQYLFAMTSGSARNGVVHRYKKPQTKLEKIFSENGWGRNSIKIVDEIKNVDASYGGRWCNHMTDNSSKYWYSYRTDGHDTKVREGVYVERSSNQYHIGCMEGEEEYKINGGTYLVTMLYRWGSNYCQVVMTEDADQEKIIKEINVLLEDE